MTSLLEPILKSPRLPALLDELESLRGKEKAKRDRFYAEISPEDKWEFINGETIMHSPAKVKHLRIRDNLNDIFRAHLRQNPLGEVFGEKALCTFERNDYESDICFFNHDTLSGVSPESWKLPVPDLIVEVLSDSTQDRDRGIKFEDYAASGVEEYWIVDPDDETIEQYFLQDGNYHLAIKARDGQIESRVLTGLIAPIRAAFDSGELARHLSK